MTSSPIGITRRGATAGALLFFSALGTAMSQQADDRLKGVSKATVLVDYEATGSTPVGLSESRLRTILELKLRTAGFRVLTEQEDAKDPAINPYLFLRVVTLQTRNQSGAHTGYAYKLDLSARVFTVVLMNSTRAPAELWSNGTMGVGSVETSSSQVEQITNELADGFLNAWLAANPKRQSSRSVRAVGPHIAA